MNGRTGPRLATLAGTLALLAGAAFAQNAGQTAATPDPSQLTELDDDRTDVTFEGLALDDVEGAGVYSPAGEEIGEIEEILGDAGGQIRAFVVEIEEGFLGLDEREVVVPAERLTLDAQQQRFTSELTKGDLENLRRWED